MFESNRRNPNSKGHTLLEVLTVCVLLLIAGVLMAYLCRFGLQTFSQVNAQIENQQKSVIIMNKINRELAGTRKDTMTLAYHPSSITKGNLALSFAVPTDVEGNFCVDADDRPIYQAYLVFYLDKNSDTLRSRRIEIEKPSTNPGSMDKDKLFSCLTNSGTPVTKGVIEFKALEFNTEKLLETPSDAFRLQVKLDDRGNQRLKASSTLTRSFRIKL
jgi:hypothetical protein